MIHGKGYKMTNFHINTPCYKIKKKWKKLTLPKTMKVLTAAWSVEDAIKNHTSQIEIDLLVN